MTRALVRKRAGLTQYRLSKITGIPSATISLWENHEIELSERKVELIARAISHQMSQASMISTPADVVRVLVSENLAGTAA